MSPEWNKLSSTMQKLVEKTLEAGEA